MGKLRLIFCKEILILQRNFKADKPNKKWSTDITEFSLFGRKLYLSPIIDLYNGEIISYKVSERPVLKQVTDMVKEAVARIGKTDSLILHSDQGWQYQHKAYRKILKENGIIQSMSRKGNCLDNAVIENFFGLLKSELFYFEKFKSIEDFKEKLDEYIDYYNNRRIKVKLKGLDKGEIKRTQSGRIPDQVLTYSLIIMSNFLGAYHRPDFFYFKFPL